MKKTDIENIKFIRSEGEKCLEDTINFSLNIDNKTAKLLILLSGITIAIIGFLPKAIKDNYIAVVITSIIFVISVVKIITNLLEVLKSRQFSPRGERPMKYLQYPDEFVNVEQLKSLTSSCILLDNSIENNIQLNQNKASMLDQCIKKSVNLFWQTGLLYLLVEVFLVYCLSHAH